MARTSELFCHKYEDARLAGGVRYDHFSPNPYVARLYDSSAVVLKVLVTEAAETPDSYWGWWENKHDKFQLVYCKRGLIEMCFAYGTRVETDRGRGFLLPVTVEEIPSDHPQAAYIRYAAGEGSNH